MSTVSDDLIGTQLVPVDGHVPNTIDPGSIVAVWNTDGFVFVEPQGFVGDKNLSPFPFGSIRYDTDEVFTNFVGQYEVELKPGSHIACSMDIKMGRNEFGVSTNGESLHCIFSPNVDAFNVDCFVRLLSGGTANDLGTITLAPGVHTIGFSLDEDTGNYEVAIDEVAEFAGAWPFAFGVAQRCQILLELGDSTVEATIELNSIFKAFTMLAGEVTPPIVTTTYEYSPLVSLGNFSRRINPFGIPKP